MVFNQCTLISLAWLRLFRLATKQTCRYSHHFKLPPTNALKVHFITIISLPKTTTSKFNQYQFLLDSDIYLNGENITTGVAIADISDGFYLYFGCRGGKPVEGGAGRLRMHTNGESGSMAHVEALTDSHDTIYAGSMFLTDLCDIDIRPIYTGDKGYNSSVDSDATNRGMPTSSAAPLAATSPNPLWTLILLTFALLWHRPSYGNPL